MRPVQVDENWYQWASPIQKQYLDAVKQHGSIRAAAKALGVAFTTVHGCVEVAKKNAILRGYSPEHDMTHPVPAPYVVKGTSTLYGEDGSVRAQWVKTKLNQEQLDRAVREFVDGLSQEVKGLAQPIKAPQHTNADLLAIYPIGDPHFGMYSWAAEAGDDFDTEIAERQVCGAVDRLVASAPDAEEALLLNLGDMFHADNMSNATPQNKNPLDVDTRWMRVLQIGRRAMIYCIKRLAGKHKRVRVRIQPGNHDPHSALALALILDAFFHNDKRIEIDLSPALHVYYRFGANLIGVTHGDTTHMKDLAGVMAADRADDWGKTKHRYWYCGHVHHSEVREFHTVLVEYFRTLAAKDAWSAGKGYRAGRDMRCIVLHREHGEIERHRCDIGMLQ